MVEPDLEYDALDVGHQFPAMPVVLNADFVRDYVQATGHDHALFTTGYAPPLMSNMVRFVKGSLGGKWPAGTVHLNQELELHRPLKQGETVTLDIRVGSKTIRKGRSYIEFISTTLDAEQQIVGQGMMRLLWWGAAQASTSQATTASKAVEPRPAGRALVPLAVEVSREMVEAYAEVAAARDPIHLDPVYARDTRFGKPIAQGLLVLSFLARLLTREYDDAWMTGGSLKVRFARPAIVGDPVTVHGIERESSGAATPRRCIIWCENAQGEALIEGEAVIP